MAGCARPPSQSKSPKHRGVAQLGSALRSGRRGPGFKSRLPDHPHLCHWVAVTMQRRSSVTASDGPFTVTSLGSVADSRFHRLRRTADGGPLMVTSAATVGLSVTENSLGPVRICQAAPLVCTAYVR